MQDFNGVPFSLREIEVASLSLALRDVQHSFGVGGNLRILNLHVVHTVTTRLALPGVIAGSCPRGETKPGGLTHALPVV